MGQLAVLDPAADRPVGMDGGRRDDLPLLVGETLRRKRPIGVLEGKAAEDDVAHRLARLRIALQPHQLLRGRRDDLDLAHVFAGQRMVVEHAQLAVQVPRAGRVEGLEHIVHIVPTRPSQRAPTPAGEEHGMVLLVNLADPQAGFRPELEHDHFHVIQVSPALADVARLELKRPQVQGTLGLRAGAHPAAGVHLRQAGRDERTFFGQSRPEPPLAVDEELAEVPVAGLDLGQFDLPQRSLVALPAGDQRPAAKDGLFRGVGLINRRAAVPACILRRSTSGCVRR